jgi:hypothetical protein
LNSNELSQLRKRSMEHVPCHRPSEINMNKAEEGGSQGSREALNFCVFQGGLY